jgi:hypothetical protein
MLFGEGLVKAGVGDTDFTSKKQRSFAAFRAKEGER